MAVEAHLLMGPRDGEVLSIVEPTILLKVMGQPNTPPVKDEQPEPAQHSYVREQKERRPGVFYYVYTGEYPIEDEAEVSGGKP